MHDYGLTIKEAEVVLTEFFATHDSHDGFHVETGFQRFSLELSCPECGISESIVINNPAYRQAASEELEANKVVLF